MKKETSVQNVYKNTWKPVPKRVILTEKIPQSPGGEFQSFREQLM